jgi:hypothetical protein
MKLIAGYAKKSDPYLVKATQPYLTRRISDGHRNDVPAKKRFVLWD